MSKITIIEGNSNEKDNVRVIMVKGEKGEQGDLNHNDIIDNLTSTDTDKVLSANQGKVLKDIVDNLGDLSQDDIIDNLTSSATDKVLSAKQGKVLKGLIDENASDIISNGNAIDGEIAQRISDVSNLQDRIATEENTRSSTDNNLQNQINSLASGSPLSASSTSGMTDTSKIYVNTTDGKWYYYNGNTWVAGGTYQATTYQDEYDNLVEEIVFGYYEIKQSEIIQGMWYQNYFDNSVSTRIACKNIFRLKKGDIIVNEDTSHLVMQARWYQTSTPTQGTGTGWVTTATAPYDCYVSLTFKAVSDANITPSDYDTTVKIYRTYAYQVVEDVDTLKEKVDNGYYTLKQNDISQGVWYQNYRDNNVSTRLGTKEAYPVKKGDKIYIGASNTLNAQVRWYQNSELTGGIGNSFSSGYTATAPFDGFVVLNIEKITDTDNITVNDYDMDIRLCNNFVFRNHTKDYLPDYWNEYLNDTIIPAIKTKDETIGFNGVSFAFITDIHEENNVMYSPAILRKIIEKTAIRKIVCGGDLITLYSTRDEAMSSIYNWKDAVNDLPVVTLFGNHDNNLAQNATVDSDKHVTKDAFYGIFNRQCEHQVNWVKGTLCGYEDNEVQKVRFLYLDTGAPLDNTISWENVMWLKEILLATPSGYTVVILCHQYLYYNTDVNDFRLMSSGTRIETAINEVYNDLNCTIACIIAGHSHRDHCQLNANNIPIILTTCDAFYSPPTLTKIKGTTTEQAFDIFHIDTENRIIYTTRVGAGENRQISY